MSLISFPVLPPLHGGAGVPTGPLNSHWYLEPTIGLGVFGAAVAYLLWVGPLNRRRPGAAERPVTGGQVACFLGGCATLLVALGPPLDDWSDYYLLSAHMVQHLLLVLLAPPLLLLGLPAWVLRPLLRWRLVARTGYLLTRAVPAFGISAAVMVVWHAQPFYDAALGSAPIHILEHQLFLASALLAWWPVVGPLPEWPRLALPLQCLYLFLQTLPGGVVGSIITMAAPGLYEHYRDAPRWGMSLATDQEVAGLLMWVGASTIYLMLISVIFFRWAAQEEAKEGQPPASVRPRSVATRP